MSFSKTFDVNEFFKLTLVSFSKTLNANAMHSFFGLVQFLSSFYREIFIEKIFQIAFEIILLPSILHA